MGIIKAAAGAIGSSLADQWLEVIEPEDMGDQTLLTRGVKMRTGSNTKSSSDTISNGSVIHVYDNQFMLLVDGGRIIDYTAEPGYYTVNNSSMPSLFNGELEDAVRETFSRFKFGGVTPTAQKVYYINLQEIKGIRFGTRNPINYFDNFYNAELFLRAHGTYSIKITDPLLFYAEAVPRNSGQVEIDEINEQYLSEFLEALQTSINQMSADGSRISFVSSKARELGKYMAQTLDEDWRQMRGIEIQAVGIASISYDEESQKLINMRNQGAMLGDPSIREGYVQGAIAHGLEAAGSNPNGSMAGFMGMGMGMQNAGNFMGTASANNMQQMQMNQEARNANAGNTPNTGNTPNAVHTGDTGNAQALSDGASSWNCQCGTSNSGKFCSNCGKAKPEQAQGWVCDCGTSNTGRFCSNCGSARPVSGDWTCACGVKNTGKFCSECGKPRP